MIKIQMEVVRNGCGLKSLFLILVTAFCLICFGVITFLGSAYAQNNNTVLKKQIKQSPAKAGKIITVGDHGQFKGFDGFQMALNMAQDMNEIRIERGIIVGSGLSIAQSKVWEHGIKISGGWDAAFSKKSNNPEDTVLYGGTEGNRGTIFTISKKVFVENLAFKNSVDSAIVGNATFTNCIFANNSTGEYGSGGAVKGDGLFYNCKFINNSAAEDGGAVAGNATFTNCIFTNNSAGYEGQGGAVEGVGAFYNCKFINNSSGRSGGAFHGVGSFFNCAFINNSAKRYYGGAVDSSHNGIHISTFSNCMFTNNLADSDGGAVYGPASFNNCLFYGNKAKGTGGAFQGEGKILNSIFYKNTADKKDNDITVEGKLAIDFSLFNYLSGAADIGTNIVMGDPKFIDPDHGDFHLRSDSPCIGKGKRLPGLKDAKNINVKPGVTGKGINMGAAEAVLTSALEDYPLTLEAKLVSERVTIDKKPGLMWVKDGNSAGCNNGEKLDWPSAMAFCEGLTYAGYSDWRLPSREELGGICDDGRHSGLFANTKTTFYWTASTDVPDTGKAWQVDFYSGINTEKTDNSYVCCVRTTSVSEPVKSETQKSEDVSLAKEDTVAP